MSFFTSLLLVACSSLLLSIGIPNELYHFGSSLPGFLCFIPLYYVFFKSNSRLKTALMYSFFVCLTHLFSSFWLVHFQDFAIFTLGASTVAYFFLAFPFGVFFHHIFSHARIEIRPFLFALTITLWEYFKSSGFLAYPWGVIAMTTLELKHFIQMADVTGVWGISYVMALIGAIESETLLSIFGLTDGLKKNATKCNIQSGIILYSEQRKPKRPLIIPLFFTIFLILIINIYGFFSLNKQEEPIKNLSLLLVQQNADPWYDSLDKSIGIGQKLTREGLRQHPNIDLVVWSESSLSIPYEDYKYVYEQHPVDDPFLPFLNEIDKPILIGTSIKGKDDPQEMFNGVILIDQRGDVLNSYAKMQLVPFAEFLPFIDNPLVKKLFSSLVGFSSGYDQGSKYKIFTVPNAKNEQISFASPVCYEDAFPSLCASLHEKGSDLLINLTNDSWSKTDSAEYQHFAVAYFRAIELRTPLVRSTNAGFTCVIDPYGNIVKTLPLFKEGFLYVDVPLYSHKTTPYTLFKDWIPTLLFVILLIYVWKTQSLYERKKNEYTTKDCHWEKNVEVLYTPSIKISKKRTCIIKIHPVSPINVKLKKKKGRTSK